MRTRLTLRSPARTGRLLAVLLIAAAVAVTAYSRHVASASASPDADPLPDLDQRRIDHSMLLVDAEIKTLGPKPKNAPGIGATYQWVVYKVNKLLKGTCDEKELVVEHYIGEPNSVKGSIELDPAKFAVGRHVLLGVKLTRYEPPIYTLSGSYGPEGWSEELERKVGKRVGVSSSAEGAGETKAK